MIALQASQLSKSYSNGVQAVDNLDIEIKQGEVFGFLGPNGAGKSTSISMMIGLIRPSSGEITILGQPLSKDNQTDIGYIPQKLIFYEHLTVLENLELFAETFEIEQKSARIDEVMKLLKISNLANRRASQLSGGQARRLNVALGLLHTPKILFADEPSAGMDPQSRNILWATIREIAAQGVTIVLTTHLMETADLLSDRIAIMDHGKVVAMGSSQQLKQESGISKTILAEVTRTEDIGSVLDRLDLVWRVDGMTVKITYHHQIPLGQLIQDLEAVTTITNLKVHEPTLEDVFIEITGRSLRE